MDRGAADDGPRMNDHPQFRMWKDRLDAEMARQEEWSARRASRERARAGWYEAWRAYKARATELYEPIPKPRWWNLPGWARWLLRLHAPGRPN